MVGKLLASSSPKEDDMRLPKAGVAPENLKCKICSKKADEQPNDIKQCENKDCPFKVKK